jgi:cytoskeleton protein RodZ
MAAEASGIGARLRAGRERMGLSVLQVAERMHTDPKIVEAVEADNFEVMGAPVYARGHIRHYAELVGETAAELIALYSDSSKVAQPDISRIVKTPSAGDSNKLVAAALLMIGVFAVAGAVWWISALKAKKPQLSETHVVGEEPSPPLSSDQEAPPDSSQPPAQASSPSNSLDRGGSSGQMAAQPRSEASGAGVGAHSRAGSDGGPGRGGSAAGQGRLSSAGAAGVAGSGAQGRSGSAGAPNSEGGAGAHGHSGAPPSGSGAAATLARGNAAGSSANPAGSPAGAGTSRPEAAPAYPKNQAQVVLRYSSDSWTEVYDANGARLFYDVGTANTAQTIVGTPPLRIVLGNASGVAVQVNGHNVPITQLALLDGSVQFSINRSGHVIRSKPVADGG